MDVIGHSAAQVREYLSQHPADIRSSVTGRVPPVGSAAMLEWQGRPLEKIYHAGDAAISAARQLVSIPCRIYARYLAQNKLKTERRFREGLEQALNWPLAVPGVRKSWLLSQESEADEAPEPERVLARNWIAATECARAESMQALADSHTVRFEVKQLRVEPPAAPEKPAMPPPPG